MSKMKEIEEILKRVSTNLEELAIAQKKNETENEKGFREMRAGLDELRIETKKTDAMLRNLGFNYGTHAEEYFYYALEESLKLGNIKFDAVLLNEHRHKKDLQDEFDILLVNGAAVALLEVKSKVHQNDLLHLTTKKVENFRKLMPEYKHCKLYLGIAGFSVPRVVEKEAISKGVAVLRQKGHVMVTSAKHLIAY